MNNLIKSKTRIAAVQVIFQSLINQKNISNIIDEFNQFYKNKIIDHNGDRIEYNKNFLTKLINYYTITSSTFDFKYNVDKYLKFNRLFNKWDLINQSIMMMAISELKHTNKEKNKIIINEYIELSKLFLSPKDTKIVNALLDKFLNEKNEEN